LPSEPQTARSTRRHAGSAVRLGRPAPWGDGRSLAPLSPPSNGVMGVLHCPRSELLPTALPSEPQTARSTRRHAGSAVLLGRPAPWGDGRSLAPLTPAVERGDGRAALTALSSILPTAA